MLPTHSLTGPVVGDSQPLKHGMKCFHRAAVAHTHNHVHTFYEIEYCPLMLDSAQTTQKHMQCI